MGKYLKKKISIISFLFIPIVYFWDPNWLEFLGVQPYWPLFWLLPWSMIYGSFNGLIIGLFLGLICLLYTSPSPRDRTRSRMPSSA